MVDQVPDPADLTVREVYAVMSAMDVGGWCVLRDLEQAGKRRQKVLDRLDWLIAAAGPRPLVDVL